MEASTCAECSVLTSERQHRQQALEQHSSTSDGVATPADIQEYVRLLEKLADAKIRLH